MLNLKLNLLECVIIIKFVVPNKYDIVMKKLASIIIAILLSLFAIAQTQQGYVKTKGRLNSSGTIIPGKRLSGATIVLKGGSSVVSGANGSFSMKVPSNQYHLQNVKKNGYLLVDPEVLSKTYVYSTNPLIISMETPDEQSSGKLANERQIRRTLRRTIQQKEDEIEALKEQNKISEEEYRKSLQKIYDEQSKNEKLISEMAERYSKIDYDQISDFDREFNQYILNGELTKADSLLNTKGDIDSRIKEYKDSKKAIEDEEEKLEKSKVFNRFQLEDIANDCYKKYERFKIEYKNDSATYYIELRASLDTTNVKWQLDAGEFINNYIANYDKALEYYNYALRKAIAQYGEQYPLVATTYENIAKVHYDKENYADAFRYMQKVLEIRLQTLGESHPDIADSYNNIGMIYYSLVNYPEALNHYQKALEINLQVYGESHPSVATSYNNIGSVLNNQWNYSDGLKYHQKALEIRLQTLGESHPDIAQSYNNIGFIYHYQRNYEEALNLCRKALEIHLQIYGESHPSVATSYNNIGMVYYSQGNYNEALNYFKKALGLRLQFFEKSHSRVQSVLYNMGLCRSKM